ncbi:phage tail length tape measure family protein [Clostridium diolis]|uniref:phage tail length tape measure family protein n=1 Tax=Clostridium diolis TaxID=223919 RepID=UPI001FA8F837|nr:phage tail length tape measure family protein [Clostridium diolis]
MANTVNMNQINMTQINTVVNLTQNVIIGVQKAQESIESLGAKAVETSQKVNETVKSAGFGNKIASGLNSARQAIGEVGNSMAGFLKDCVDGAAKSEKINKDLAQTIKSTGGAAGFTAEEVSKMASQLSNASTFGAGAIKTGQSMLLTFTNIGKDVFPAASQAMVDMAQKMGTDPVEASKALGKALNDPTRGLADLNGIGITFTDQQKKQVEAMQKTGDTAGAQKLILNELNKEFGGQAAAAADTYAGKLQQLSNTISGIKSSIGDALLPYAKKVAEVFLSVAQSIKNIPQPIMDIIAKALGLTAVFGTLIGGFGMFKNMIGTFFQPLSGVMGLFTKFPLPIMIVIGVIALLATAFATNFGGIRDSVVSVFNKISSAVKSAIDVFKKTGSASEGIGVFFSSLFGPKVGSIVTSTIKVIIATVKSVIDFIKAHMPQIQSIIQNVFKGIQSVWNSILKPVLTFAIQIFSKLISFVISNWPLIKQTITTVMTAIKTVISTALNMIMAFWNVHGQTIKTVVSSAFNIIKTVIMTVLNVITGVIKTVMQVINGDWSGAWNTIKSTVGTVFNGAIDIIRNILNAIGSIFKDVAKTAISWGKDMIMGIVDGIRGAVGYIEDAISGVADRIRAFLHFSVPDKGPLTDYETWMPDFLKGMGRGIKVNTHLVTEPIKDLAVGIKTGVNKNLSLGNKTGSQGFKGASGSTKDDSTQNGFAITIAKLADSIIIREESDIDKIATALANKLSQTALGMS